MRRKPSLAAVLLLVNLAALILPLGGLWMLRVYESALIRQTESELIAQGAIVAAVYKSAWLSAGGRGAEAGGPIDPRWTRQPGYDERWQPLFPSLDLSSDPVLPPPSDPEATSQHPDAAAQKAGAAMAALLKDAQRNTLAGIRLLDRQGLIVGGTGEEGLGQSLAALPEVTRALAGEPVSLLRQRAKGPAPSAIALSRGSALRVFTALPVLVEGDRLAGVVLLSRTPRSLAEALYGKRWHLAVLVLLLLASVAAPAGLGLLVVARPLRQVTVQAKRAAEGEQGAVTALPHTPVREVAELSQALSRMTATLEQRAGYIRDFAAHVSHEFKTPLASIRGTVELLRDHLAGMSEAERNRFLGNLDQDAERLDRLVRRLLDLARADVMTHAEATGCDGRAVLDVLTARYRASGLKLTLEPGEALTLALPAEVLEAMLVNLLENARQHGGADVAVHLSLRQDGDTALLTVRDDGPGISDANAGKVFAPFFTTARKQGGTGLGLAITASMAQAHGGKVRLVASGQGACFELTLPLGQG